MKKLFFILFFSIFFTANAQRIGAALIGGITTSQVSGDQLSGFDKVGFLLGASAFTPLSSKWNFQVEILYVQKGSKKDQNPEKDDYEIYKMKLSYAEVPLIFQYRIKERLIFEAGPSAAFLLSSKEEDNYGELHYNRPFKKYDISLNGGLGYRIIDRLFFFGRLSNSILPIRENLSGYNPYRLDRGQYNTVIEFTLRYSFKSSRQLAETQ